MFMTIEDFFEINSEVAVAFSGGVDSTYLLYMAKQYAKKVKAYYVKSEFQPDFEYKAAVKFAKQYEIDLTVKELNVLEDKAVAANPANRCYFCKQRIFGEILKSAKSDGFDTILDGTNASDDEGDRPGMKALKELGILSPLRECNLTKDEIRARSKEAGLVSWDKPAYACLATRVKTGQAIDREILEKVEKAESFLAVSGFRDFRVRVSNNNAKIQVRAEQMELITANRAKILTVFETMFDEVVLDLKDRR